MASGVEAFVLRTAKRHWFSSHNTNQTASTDTTLAATASSISQGAGYIDAYSANVAKILCHGVGAPGDSLVMRLYGLSPVAEGDIQIPSFIAKLTWSFPSSGGVTGVAGKSIDETNLFADSVVLNDGDTSIRLITDTTGNVASVTVDLEGAAWLYVQFDTTGVTEPTSWNASVGLF